MNKIANGIYQCTFGEQEIFNADSFRLKKAKFDVLNELSDTPLPFKEEDITFKKTSRGITLSLPMKTEEEIYGFGLQLKSLNNAGKKKFLRTNADPVADTGDSHAPVPFYVSTCDNTKAYGLLVDTVKYTTFYCGSSRKAPKEKAVTVADDSVYKEEASTVVEASVYKEEASTIVEASVYTVKTTVEELYGSVERTDLMNMLIEVEHVEGCLIYLFSGETVEEVCRKYILFSGGGCMPPLYGLGIWYRADGRFNQDEVLNIAKTFRAAKMPISVLGLEPGWQTHAYSCTFKFSPERYPDPDTLLNELENMHYKVNLWEHVFTHPTSPLYESLLKYAGDYEVWGGIVPDLSIEEAREILKKYHKEYLLDKGVSGFKLDECDGSDYTGGWSYPNTALFPSGLTGEQMHSILPQLYQKTMVEAFREKGIRTLGEVRADFSYSAPYPFMLYSDLYGHSDYINGLINMGFTGLLYSPEIREAVSEDDLYRRILTGVFSPKLEFNIWYMKNPPWFNYKGNENNSDIALKNSASIAKVCRELMKLRMKLVPYLYSAFFRYYNDGIHPFRALQSDYPETRAHKGCVQGYSMGQSLLVFPLKAGENDVKVYLPKGRYYCFFTDELYEGDMEYSLHYEATEIPVFVKEGSILPLLENTDMDLNSEIMNIVPYIYGDNAEGELYEDDGNSYDFETGKYNIYYLTYENESLSIDKDGEYEGKKAVFSTYKLKTSEKID